MTTRDSFVSSRPSFQFATVQSELRTTENLEIGNWVETRQNCLVLSAVVVTPPTWTRQDSLVLSCPCRRREQGITKQLVLLTDGGIAITGAIHDGQLVGVIE